MIKPHYSLLPDGVMISENREAGSYNGIAYSAGTVNHIIDLSAVLAGKTVEAVKVNKKVVTVPVEFYNELSEEQKTLFNNVDGKITIALNKTFKEVE